MNNEDIIYDMLDKWRRDYCCGKPMTKIFRKNCSKIFDFIYHSCLHEQVAIDSGKVVYRAFNLDSIVYYGSKFVCDGLYYSFSSDIDGIFNFCYLDKHFKNGKFILLECSALNAIDYEKLLSVLYSDYDKEQDRYSNEHEVVSVLNNDCIKNIYYIEHLEDLYHLDSCLKLAYNELNKKDIKNLLKFKKETKV